MNCPCLSNLSNTQSLISYVDDIPYDTCLDIIKKVCTAVIAAFLIIPTFIIDLAIGAYNYCFGEPEFDVDVLEKCDVPEDVNEFFKKSIEYGFRILNPEQRKIYKEMIENDGLLPSADSPINIFQWLSDCHLCFGLVNEHIVAKNLVPEFDSLNSSSQANIIKAVINPTLLKKELNNTEMVCKRKIRQLGHEDTQRQVFHNFFIWNKVAILKNLQ